MPKQKNFSKRKDVKKRTKKNKSLKKVNKKVKDKKKPKIIIKNISEKDFEEESKLEEQVEKTQEESIGFLQPSLDVKAPVLEKVAIREENDLSKMLSDMASAQSQRTEENREIDYTSTRSDYVATSGDATRNSKTNNIETNYNNPIFQETKESRETKRMLTGGEFNQRNQQRDIQDIERPMDIKSEEIEETKKYLSRGDYK